MGLHLPSWRFRSERERAWRELERCLDVLEHAGIRGLGPADLEQLPALHRAALSSLSVARAIALDLNLVSYLEGLAARSHIAVYQGTETPREGLVRFAAQAFPRAARALRWHLCIAAALFCLGGAVAFVRVAEDDRRYGDFIPAALSQGRNPTSTTKELREVLYSDQSGDEAALASFGSFLFTHNARIGLLSLGLGVAAGVPAAVLMFQNGLVLGAFGALYTQRGLGWDFWAWVLPHGVTEILALLLCAAAGLSLGQAVVLAGPRSRLESLRLRGADAGTVALGAIVLFALAGALEGFFRQLVLDPRLRLSVASASALLWALYFARAGRR